METVSIGGMIPLLCPEEQLKKIKQRKIPMLNTILYIRYTHYTYLPKKGTHTTSSIYRYTEIPSSIYQKQTIETGIINQSLTSSTYP